MWKNLASHWIQDRLNEKLWMDENALYHFQQVAFAAGLNSRNADSTGYAFVMPFSSIRNVKIWREVETNRILADGTGCNYSDVRKQIADREWPLNGYGSNILWLLRAIFDRNIEIKRYKCRGQRTKFLFCF